MTLCFSLFLYHFQKRCLKLICPLGSAAYFGICQKTVVKIYKLDVSVRYSLQVADISNINLEDSNLFDNNKLQNLIVTTFQRLLDDADFACEPCGTILRQVVGQDGHQNEYVHQYTFPISDSCQLDQLLEHVTRPISKQLNIVIDNTLSLKYIISFEKRSPQTIRKYKIVFYDAPFTCRASFILQRGLICPAVRINSSELGTNLKLFQNEVEVDNMDMNNTFVEVCWDDYKRFLLGSASNYHHISWLVGLYSMSSVLLY